MPEKNLNLGKLTSVYGIAPAYMQRAAVIAIVSFIFFLAMLGGFYLRQNIGYFLLSTAFLIIYIFMMLGLFTQRRSVFNIYEEGFSYKNFVSRWEELESIEEKKESRFSGLNKINYEICKKNGEKMVLTDSIQGVEKIFDRLAGEIKKESEQTTPENDRKAAN